MRGTQSANSPINPSSWLLDTKPVHVHLSFPHQLHNPEPSSVMGRALERLVDACLLGSPLTGPEAAPLHWSGTKWRFLVHPHSEWGDQSFSCHPIVPLPACTILLLFYFLPIHSQYIISPHNIFTIRLYHKLCFVHKKYIVPALFR